jgi:putative intracellular protease/amidase
MAAGAERLRDCATLSAIVKKQAAAKLPYAAMCASPAVVLSAQGLLDGVAATAHPAFSDQVRPRRGCRVTVLVKHGLCTGAKKQWGARETCSKRPTFPVRSRARGVHVRRGP